mgnify:CR=1 FL=1
MDENGSRSAAAPPAAPAQDFAPPESAAADFAPPSDSPSDPAGDEYLKDSHAAQELYDRAVREAAEGDERDAVVHLLRASKLAETAREWYLVAAACHRIGDMYRSPGGVYDLARAVRMYQRAIAAYQHCGLFSEARRLTYRVASLQLWHAPEVGVGLGHRIELLVFWAVAGFGLRPLRVLAVAVAVVLGYAAAYWAIDGVGPQSGEPVPTDFRTAVYFSGITFTTVGFGDLVPAPHARLLAMSEGAAGFVTVSFFVVVLANRLRT